jgi:hypothetical protein
MLRMALAMKMAASTALMGMSTETVGMPPRPAP